MRRFERTRNDAGAAAVEFGLIAIVLLTLLIGIIQFAIWFWAYQSGSHAAREAARFAAVSPCVDGPIQARGATRVDEGAPTSDTATVDVSRSADPLKVGDEITVRVQFTTLNFGFFPGFSGAIDKRATARVENVPPGGC